MRLLSLVFSLALTTTLGTAGAAPEGVGFKEIRIHSEARNKDLAVFVWYPATSGGEAVPVGEDRIFEGTPAFVDAPVAGGDHPIILLSHGSGATVQKMAWIATALAEAGFVVAGPNHPGTTSGDSTPEDTPKLWERTDDLSMVLSALLAEPNFRSVIDPDKIGALGFSLGGAAVLQLAGARARLDDYVRYCDTYPDMPDCRWFAGGRAYVDQTEVQVEPYDLRNVDQARFEQSNLDARLQTVVAVDPALATAFNLESLEEVQSALHFVNLGAHETVPIAVRSDTLASRVSHGSLTHIENAVHFSFLPVCRQGAKAFMKAIGEADPLCSDEGNRSRAALHEELEQTIVDLFRSSFSKVK